MIISGIQKTSTIDYPGQLAAVLFAPGCNYDCFYCHNRSLCQAKHPILTIEEVKHNLLKRDHDDTHRKENPLMKAKDAIVLDNTDLSKEQQLEFVIKLIADMQLTKDKAV